MKKIFITISFVLACALVAPVAEAIPAAMQTVSESYTRSVPVFCFKGHVKTQNRASVNVTDDGVTVTFGGETYSARTSNRSGYDYMFTASSGTTWYFNL